MNIHLYQLTKRNDTQVEIANLDIGNDKSCINHNYISLI